MFFLFAHRTREDVDNSRTVQVLCRGCGQVIQSNPQVREHAGWFLVLPYRFRRPFVTCPHCGTETNVEHG